MFAWFSKYHGLSAITGAALALFGFAQNAATAGILPPKVAAAVALIGVAVATFSPKPGTLKAQ